MPPPSDKTLRLGLVKALILAERTGELKMKLAGAILDRWDEMVKKKEAKTE